MTSFKKRAAKQQSWAAEQAQKAKPRWILHRWCEERGRVLTDWLPGFFRKPKGWHAAGTIDEVEMRENAGQRSLF